MPTFEELLKSSQATAAYDDKDWMDSYHEVLVKLPNEYLVEALKATLTVSAMKLIAPSLVMGNYPSFEVVKHSLVRVLELLREGIDEQ